MSRFDLYSRIHCNLAGMDWATLVLGAKDLSNRAIPPWFTPELEERLREAEGRLREIGPRVRILDRETFPTVSATSILGTLEDFKSQVDARRAFIVIDYLQLIPVPEVVSRSGDLEADKYRVRVAQDVVAGTRTTEQPVGDAVLVISEARKPSDGRRAWGESLSDLMGSARLPYAADAVLMYRAMNDDDLANAYGEEPGSIDTLREELEEDGISPVILELAKGRDGMRRGTLALEFEFTRSRFREITPGQGPRERGARFSSPAPGAGQERRVMPRAEGVSPRDRRTAPDIANTTTRVMI